MNSLPPYPSQQAFKASNKLLSAPRTSKALNDPAFRTHNLDIFPSLSPFSNFYKNKKQNETNAPSKRCADILEPVKKCKLNNGNCKVVSKENELSHYTTPTPILPKVVADKDNFRVPRLPKRLCEKNETSDSSKVTLIGNLNQSSGLGLADCQGSFAVKDSFRQDLKVKQEESLSDLSTRAQPADDNMSDMAHLETVKKVDQEVSNKDQNGTAYPSTDASFLTGLYEKLKLEYLMLQYNEQMNSVRGNVQDSQLGKQETNINFGDLVILSKDIFKEHVKKTEVDC